MSSEKCLTNDTTKCIGCDKRILKIDVNDGYCIQCACRCGSCDYCLEIEPVGDGLVDD